MANTLTCTNCGKEIVIPESSIVQDITMQKDAEIKNIVYEEKALEQQKNSELAKLKAEYEAKVAAVQQELDAKTKQLADVQTQLTSLAGKVQP